MLIGVTNAHLIRGRVDSGKTAQYEQRIQMLEQQLTQVKSRSSRRNIQQRALPASAQLRFVCSQENWRKVQRQRKGESERKESFSKSVFELVDFRLQAFPRVDASSSSEETVHETIGHLLQVPSRVCVQTLLAVGCLSALAAGAKKFLTMIVTVQRYGSDLIPHL